MRIDSRKQRVNRTWTVLAVAAVVMSALTLAVAASASAATQHWYSCLPKVGGQFANASCSQTSYGSNWETEKLSGATKINIKPGLRNGETVVPVGFRWVEAGIPFEVTCKAGAKGSATVENPSGGGAGTLKGMSLTLSSCTILLEGTSHGCVITGGTIFTEALYGTATELSGVIPGISLQSSSLITSFNVTGCSPAIFSHKYSINGELLALQGSEKDPTWNEFLFQPGGIKVNGNSAGAFGSIIPELSSHSIRLAA